MTYTIGRPAGLPDAGRRPATKAALIERMLAERARWDDLIARIPPAILTLTVLPNGWSVKDLAAHVAAYEKWTAAQIAAANAGRIPTDLELYGMAQLPADAAGWDVDQQNEVIYTQYKNDPLAQVMAFASQAFADLVAAVEAVPADDIDRIGAQAWAGRTSLLDVVPAQSYEHYHQHIDDLRAVVTGVAPSEQYRGYGQGAAAG